MAQSSIQQKKQTTERAVGVGFGGNRERGFGQILKKEGVGNIGGPHKIGGLVPLCQLSNTRFRYFNTNPFRHKPNKFGNIKT